MLTFQKIYIMYSIPIQIRWADIDANNHLRHSVYYDFGAMCRMKFMSDYGLTMKRLEELKVGPIILREEAVFKKEVHFHDLITLSVSIYKAKKDFTRWSLIHHLTKADGTVATIMTIDGAWLDLEKRKISVPNQEVISVFNQFPKSENFEWIE